MRADVTRSYARESSLSPRTSRSIGAHGPVRHHDNATASSPSSSARIFVYSSFFFVTLFRTPEMMTSKGMREEYENMWNGTSIREMWVENGCGGEGEVDDGTVRGGIRGCGRLTCIFTATAELPLRTTTQSRKLSQY